MKIRSITVAMLCAASMVLAGCSSAISGAPQADPAGAAQQDNEAPEPSTNDSGTDNRSDLGEDAPSAPDDEGSNDAYSGDNNDGSGDDGDLTLPGADDSIPSDLGDLGSLLDGLGQAGSGSDAQGLQDLLGQLGDGSTPDLSGILGENASECLALAGISMGAGMAVLGPMMGGQPLTQSDVDDIFGNVSNLSPEAQQLVAQAHAAMESIVGKTGADATESINNGAVADAMEDLGDYLDTACDNQ